MPRKMRAQTINTRGEYHTYKNNSCETHCVCPHCGGFIYYLLFTEEYGCPICNKIISPLDIVYEGSKKYDTSETV